MKLGFDKNKGAEALQSLARNTTGLVKKGTEGAQKGLTAAAERAKGGLSTARGKVLSAADEVKLKKLSPLFPEEYQSESFDLPNVIRIVDDAARRDEPLCAGAIGWRETHAGVEVLFLYDEAVPLSGLKFVPYVECDGIYLVDRFDRHIFVAAEHFFKRAQEERLAELEHIAYSLGAKRYTIRMRESRKQERKASKSVSAQESYHGNSAAESSTESLRESSGTHWEAVASTTFPNNDLLQVPNRKWFADTGLISELITQRMSGLCPASKTIEISYSSHSAMSANAARALSGALLAIGGVKASTSLNKDIKKEQSSTLLFHLEF